MRRAKWIKLLCLCYYFVTVCECEIITVACASLGDNQQNKDEAKLDF